MVEMVGKDSQLRNKTYFVKMRNLRGLHHEVYEDFESEILQHTGWVPIKGSINFLEKIFENYFLEKLIHRKFFFNLPRLNSDRILFASLSGIEYIKIFQHFSFKSRVKAIYQFDSWTHDNALNENAFRSFKINLSFLSIKKAAEYFNSRGIPNFIAYWVPEAINSKNFSWSELAERKIDILQYGRRWEWVHKKLFPFCNRHNINYQYPAADKRISPQFKNRKELAHALSRTKIAICVPRTITHPENFDLDTVTTRYFECMASKCLVLGRAPKDLIELFGYNPVVEVDCNDICRQVKYLITNYHKYSDMIERNYDEILRKHQWKHRINEMKRIIYEAYSCPL